jgi:leucyl/phenylalanyl-tRNA--protein transferase
VFIAIGHKPNTDLFTGQLEMRDGYLLVKGGSEGDATATAIAGYLPPAMWPTTSIARPSLPPGRMHGGTGRGKIPRRHSRRLTAHWVVGRQSPLPSLSASPDAMLTWLQRNTLTFPPLEKPCATQWIAGRRRRPVRRPADPGVPARLLSLVLRGQPILWWSPDPRTVLFPDELHVSRSLNKLLRQQRYQVTFDQDFAAVIRACAAPRLRRWHLDHEAMQDAYLELHKRGYAHSVEVWDQGELVGGLYGLAMGQLFFGESCSAAPTTPPSMALPPWCDT